MTNSLRIDRRYRGVGRIARASGTENVATHRRILSMLDGLFNIGRLDLLKDMMTGARTFLEVLYLYERGQLHKLPTADTSANLSDALWSFHRTSESGPSHKSNLKTYIKLLDTFTKKKATVADLPKLVRAIKGTMQDTPVAFNRLRTHMMAFMSEAFGKMSPEWIAVLQVNAYKKVEGRRPKARLRRPLTVQELGAVMHAFTDYTYRHGNAKKETRIARSDLAIMAWTLATTGMRPQEYWQKKGATWSVELTHVQVNGTKTAAAKRPTFLLGVTTPACSDQFYRERFAEATVAALGLELDLYSLRRTFATFMESARIEPSRARAYLGHGPKTVSDIYLAQSVLPFVLEDSRIVSAWIEAERVKAKGKPALVVER